MADIICPNCGKVNPSFADTCLSCQAPLPAAAPDPQPDGEEGIPEWLQRIRERTQQEYGQQEPSEEPVAPFAPGDLPEWLKDLKEEKIDKENLIPPVNEEAPVDWLEKLRTSPVYDRGEPPQTAPLPELPEESKPPSHQLWGPENGGEIPDWLKAATHADKNVLDDFVFPKREETHPDDITAPVQVEPAPNPFASEMEAAPVQRDREEVEFINSLAGSQNPPVDGMVANPLSEKASQEKLPFEPAASDVSPSGVEQAYAPDFFQTTALSNRIQLSEKQRLNVSLLKNIIAAEGEPRPIAPSPAKRSGRAGLLVVFFGIILLLLATLVITPIPSALPQLYPVEIASLFNEISTLPQNAPVLVAVEYDPALAGEMQLSSSALLGHLMSRNARLTFISTRPSGPMLADALLHSILPGQPQYSFADHTSNLGYLPGDAAGLRAFAAQPRLSMPYTFDLQRAWESPASSGVNLLSDFSAVIVITDNADVMRLWVEQAQPALGETPLFVVLSAQAGPLIQPYLTSGQIRGGLSGISGGAMYSQILGKPGITSPYLNAYQIGVLLAVLAILGGALFHLFAGLAGRSSAGAKA